MIRRSILFLFSSGLFCAGAYLLWLQGICLFGFVDGTCYVMGRAVMGGAAMTVLGGYLLWDEFISRWWSQRKSNKH